MIQQGDSRFLGRRGAVHRKTMILAIVVGIAAIATVSAGAFLLLRRQSELEANNEELSRALAEAYESREQADAQRAAAEAIAYRDAVRLADECIKGFQPERAREALENTPQSLRNWEWGYLNRKLESPARVFQGHTKDVSHVEFSPDNTKLVTASADGTAIVWDLKTKEILLHLKGHAEAVASAWLTEDGRRIITQSHDGTSRVWSAQTGQCERTLPVDPGVLFRSPASSGTVRFVTQTDWEALLWDVHSTEPVHRFSANKMRVRSAWMSPDCRQAVVFFLNGRICVFDADSGSLLLTTDGKEAMFSNDGRQFYIREEFRTSIWDTVTWEREGKELPADAAVEWHVECSPSISAFHRFLPASEQEYTYSPDRSRVAGFNGKALAVKDTATAEVSLSIEAADSLRTVCWSPSGNALLGVTETGHVILWDAMSGGQIAVLDYAELFCPATLAYFTPDGRGVVAHRENSPPVSGCSGDMLWDVSSPGDPHVQIFEASLHQLLIGSQNSISSHQLLQRSLGDPMFLLEAGKNLESLLGLDSPNVGKFARGSAVEPTGDRALIVSQSGSIGIWDLINNRLLDPVYTPAQPWGALDWSRDGKWIAAGVSDGSARVWPAEPNAPCTDVWPEETVGLRARYNSDCTLYPEGTLWAMQHPEDMNSGALRKRTSKDVVRVISAAVSPVASQVAVGGDDGGLSLWDLDSGQRLHWFREGTVPIVSIQYGPDGSTITSRDAHGLAQTRNVASGQILNETRPGAGAPGTKESYWTEGLPQLRCTSPDGSRAFLISHKGTLRVWDGKDETELLSIQLPPNALAAFGLAQNGQRLVIVYRDFTVRTVDAEPWGM